MCKEILEKVREWVKYEQEQYLWQRDDDTPAIKRLLDILSTAPETKCQREKEALTDEEQLMVDAGYWQGQCELYKKALATKQGVIDRVREQLQYRGGCANCGDILELLDASGGEGDIPYEKKEDHEKFEVPLGEIHSFQCCDCGLVHDAVFAIEESGDLGIAAVRNKEETKKARGFILMDDKINASEALYGFMGWLTSRDEVVTFSGNHNAARAAELVKEWCEENNLPEVRDNVYPDNIKHPVDTEGTSCDSASGGETERKKSDLDLGGIIKEWLELKGYDGLCNSAGECGCVIADLYPCGECDMSECFPAYQSKCGDGGEYDFMMFADPKNLEEWDRKKEEEKADEQGE